MRMTPPIGVLVVEDDDEARGLLAEFLMHEGFHSIMAANGREALARLAYVRPDVVITDLEMPVMNGVELVRALAQLPGEKPIPIIVSTSFDEDGARRELADVVSFVRVILRKPFVLSALIDAISRCLGKSAP